jgi:hypothetical protein
MVVAVAAERFDPPGLVTEIAGYLPVGLPAGPLIRDELKLAQLEITRKGKQAGTGAGLLGGGALIALYGVGCLIACVIIAISGAVAAWLAALIVGAALLAVAAIAALTGKGRLQRGTPPVPSETVSSIKTDVQQIKERARR